MFTEPVDGFDICPTIFPIGNLKTNNDSVYTIDLKKRIEKSFFFSIYFIFLFFFFFF